MGVPRVIHRNCGESWRTSPTALMSWAFCAATNLANNALTSSSVPARAVPARRTSSRAKIRGAQRIGASRFQAAHHTTTRPIENLTIPGGCRHHGSRLPPRVGPPRKGGRKVAHSPPPCGEGSGLGVATIELSDDGEGWPVDASEHDLPGRAPTLRPPPRSRLPPRVGPPRKGEE